MIKKYLLLVFLISILGAFIIFVFINRSPSPVVQETVVKETAEDLYYKTFLEDNFRTPPQISFDTSPTDLNEFDISAKYAFAVNLENNQVLFSKGARTRVPVASLVKIMTAIVALEHMQEDREVIVSEYAASVGENSMGISTGEVYTLKELLYGLILNSGNDAAVAIAEGVTGSEENFVIWMNIKAKELGLTDTKFIDPSGLNGGDKNYYSSAYDLAIISKYSLDNFPILREIYKTFSMEYVETDKHKYIYLENQTNLLTTYPGVAGIKTGYTDEAGWSLITYAENENAKILGVLLDAVNRRYDGVLLLDYCFGEEGVHIKHNLL